jgi:hypothetical protein
MGAHNVTRPRTAHERSRDVRKALASVAQRGRRSWRIGRKCRSCAMAVMGDFIVVDLLTEFCSGREVRP